MAIGIVSFIVCLISYRKRIRRRQQAVNANHTFQPATGIRTQTNISNNSNYFEGLEQPNVYSLHVDQDQNQVDDLPSYEKAILTSRKIF